MKRTRIVAYTSSLVCVVSFAVAAASFKSAHDQGNDSRKFTCVAVEDTRESFRRVLRFAKTQSQLQLPPGEKRNRAILFYDRALKLIPELEYKAGQCKQKEVKK
jgi:hypothetical protein